MGHRIDSAADVREVIREAREVVKELVAATRDARSLLKEIKDTANTSVDEHLRPILNENIKQLTLATEAAIAEADLRVDNRFQQVADILLGEDKKSKREGRQSIPDLARDKAAREEARKYGSGS